MENVKKRINFDFTWRNAKDYIPLPSKNNINSMNEKELFQKKEMPYGILKEYGLTPQMIDDLPDCILLKLYSGKRTPPLPINVELQNGEVFPTMASLQLVRLDDGINVKFYPKRETLDLKDFPNVNPQEIKKGFVICTEDGYAQYDDAIRQIWKVKREIVLHNIRIFAIKENLTAPQRDNLVKGNVVELSNGKSKCSIGIDLLEEDCLRISKGGNVDWKREAGAEKLGKYNFKIYGCWVNDNNNLYYVPKTEFEKYPDINNEFLRLQGMKQDGQAKMA